MEKGQIYFPPEFISPCVVKSEEFRVWEKLTKISMMRYWLSACNFILCIKWQTTYHAAHNPLPPWTHTGLPQTPSWYWRGRNVSHLGSAHNNTHLKWGGLSTQACWETHTWLPYQVPQRLTYVIPNLFNGPRGSAAAAQRVAEDWRRGHRGTETAKSLWNQQRELLPVAAVFSILTGGLEQTPSAPQLS